MIWQTEQWQNMLKDSNQTSNFFKIDNIFIEMRSVGMGEFGLFVIGCNFNDINENLLNEFVNLAKKEKVLFFQIENIDYSGIQIFLTQNDFDIGYYKKFITPYTAVIDLTKSEEEILSEMKPKGRYNIKLAEKKGIIVKEVEKNEKNIKIYYDLMLETTSRDSFSGHSIDYYERFLKEINNSKLLFAIYGNTILAAGIFVYEDGVAIYYYGASTSDAQYRNLMAPYLLQWTAIQLGRNKGCKIYDFLGVANPCDEKSSLVGVTDFKKKFTQDIREVSKNYIYINKKVKYKLLNLIRYLKRR